MHSSVVGGGFGWSVGRFVGCALVGIVMFCFLVSWLVCWLVGWLVGWLLSRLVGCLVGWLVGWSVYWQELYFRLLFWVGWLVGGRGRFVPNLRNHWLVGSQPDNKTARHR